MTEKTRLEWIISLNTDFPTYGYDKEGKSIGLGTVFDLRSDESYVRVGLDYLYGYIVSTVWLGNDHSLIGGPPLIFETGVFRALPDGDIIPIIRWEMVGEYMRRYPTEQQALAGHNDIINTIREAEEASIIVMKESNVPHDR